MRSLPLVLAALSLGFTTPVQAEQRCYAFWASQCFEIRDASTRDITHHVIITRGPISRPRHLANCDASLTSLLSADNAHELLEDFNDILEDIDGCNEIDRPPLESFQDASEAIARYQRLTREGSHTELHEIDAPRLPGKD